MRTQKISTLFNFAPKSKVKAGDGLDEGSFPFFTSSSVLKKKIDKAQHFDDALIFGTGGSASVHFAGEPFATSTDSLVAISKTEEINTKFVYYYLFGNIHLLEQGFKGAGLKHVSKTYIENIDIPLFTIETQNKIVAVLDKASAITNKREQTLELLENLLRGKFFEMFGDPVANPKKWPLLSFKQVVKNENSKRVPIKQSDRDSRDGQYPYYGATGIIDTIDDYKFDGEFLLIAEDGKNLLFRRKDNAFIASGKFWVNNHAHVLSYNGVCNLHYLKFFLNSIDFRPYITGIDQAKLNKDNLEKIYNFDKKYSLLKEKLNLDNTSQLFNSILQKVFNGELNFNIDFELDVLINEIDLLSKVNDLSQIENNRNLIKRLIERLNNQEFKEKDLYDKAKHTVFQLMSTKITNRKIRQEYNEKTKKIELILQ
jgi:type I restriction enzyme S subunit